MEHTYNLAGYDTWKCCVPDDDPDMDVNEIEIEDLEEEEC